jgi:endonuclease/exonuclease/phosphatase family metal-dependent hydrolase
MKRLAIRDRNKGMKTTVPYASYANTARIMPPVFLLAFALGACTVVPADNSDEGGRAGDGQSFTAAVWNLQALFDGEEKGTEYDEYRSSKGWTREKYDARILGISRAVEKLIETGVPDFIGLVEVENSRVLADLAGGGLSKHDYNWTFFGSLPGMSLGAGVLSRHPITGAWVHSVTAGGETAPRPMLEVRIEPAGEPIVFFVCHWKSKVGGEESTEVLRRASARVIRRRLEELRENEPETPVVVMGDLNENYDEFYRRAGTAVSALLPDDPRAAALAAKETGGDFLVISGEKPPKTRYFNSAAWVLYTPWIQDLENGSYYYKKNWETIDHVLLNNALFDGSGWDYKGAEVPGRPPFTGAAGYPEPYTPRNGLGLSDHLPLLLYLERP